jgi:hypothetical protein
MESSFVLIRTRFLRFSNISAVGIVLKSFTISFVFLIVGPLEKISFENSGASGWGAITSLKPLLKTRLNVFVSVLGYCRVFDSPVDLAFLICQGGCFVGFIPDRYDFGKITKENVAELFADTEQISANQRIGVLANKI